MRDGGKQKHERKKTIGEANVHDSLMIIVFRAINPPFDASSYRNNRKPRESTPQVRCRAAEHWEPAYGLGDEREPRELTCASLALHIRVTSS